jgi:hypothetical protein
MIFHYQKHTVLNYCQWRHRRYQQVSGRSAGGIPRGRSAGGIPRGWRARTSEHGGGAVVSIFMDSGF